MSEKKIETAAIPTADNGQDLELGLQELETLEAPGWGTIGGISAGASVSALVSAGIIIT
ncbi:daptide-type RiPP [Streptomyces sp. NPDC048442]|uniref:daptide-type RiPP n=1 Tax=Streptomyces sp. NPDC048442 TaxID=3154823 RepID=UPI003420FB03